MFIEDYGEEYNFTEGKMYAYEWYIKAGGCRLCQACPVKDGSGLYAKQLTSAPGVWPTCQQVP